MKCKRCKVDKPLNGRGRCGGCEEYVKNYYKTHRKQEIARSQKNLAKKSREEQNEYKRGLNRQNPLSIILQQAKRRAKLKSVPFDITIDDIEVPKVCPVLGLPLVVNQGHAKEDSMTLDRIVPELGYVKGNVAVISFKANTIKSNATVEELKKVIEWLQNEHCNRSTN